MWRPHRVSAVLHHAPSSVQDSVAMGLCVAQAGHLFKYVLQYMYCTLLLTM